jgi:hypothetical protein
MTTPSLTAIASAKMVIRCEYHRLALDVVVLTFDEGQCRSGMLFRDRFLETLRAQAARLADRR